MSTATKLIAQVTRDAMKTGVDYASHQSDRWLFLATITFIILSAILVIRYLVKTNESLVSIIVKIAENSNEASKTMAVALDRNTEALNNCGDELRICRNERR